MVRITVDHELGSKLSAAAAALEVCDGAGRVIGHFIPVADAADYASVSSPTPAHELERRQREEPGRPLSEILHDLGKLR
jgi:hypothetical protein